MEDWRGWIELIVSVGTLLGMVIFAYKIFKDPDDEAKNRINLIEQGCKNRIKSCDKIFDSISTDLHDVKENHLRHIESDISDLKADVKSILAVLKDRK